MSITNTFFEQLNDPKAALWSAGVAFNRSNPLPLDKWSVFESMEAATAYAESNAVAYPGQIIAVYDNNVMAAYILVESDNSLVLEAIGTVPVGDDISVEVVDGKLTLVGFNAAESGSQLVKGSDGKLNWVKPDTTTVDGLSVEVTKLQTSVADLKDTVGDTEKGLVADVANLQTSADEFNEDISNLKALVGEPASGDKVSSGIFANLDKKADANSVYTKVETDIAIQTNIAQAIADTNHLKRKILPDLEALESYKNEPDALQYIYMIPTNLVYVAADDKYDEYIIIEVEGTDEVGNPSVTRTIEKVGSWEVDLSDYVKSETLDDYALKTEVKDVANTVTTLGNIVDTNKTNIEDALAKEVARAQGAEATNAANIQTVSETANEALGIANEALEKANSAQDGISQININIKDRLLTDDDKAKLEKLVISDDGSVGISANINASQVKELDTWIATNGATHIKDLTETNLSESLITKINFITSVNTEEFTVTNGNLNVNIIEGSKVNLNTNDEFAATKITLADHGTSIENLQISVETNTGKLNTLETVTIPAIQAKFNDYVLSSVYNQDMTEIKDILTWKEMS